MNIMEKMKKMNSIHDKLNSLDEEKRKSFEKEEFNLID